MVVSWISFVVPPDVIPGRMALLITLFLVLVNIFNNITTNTPKAEGDLRSRVGVKVRDNCSLRSDGNRNLDVVLYSVCVWSPNW